MSRYAEFARRLPVPSTAQTREFAEYVSGAHSWYKHLRVHPPQPFVFFLDPNSGRSMVRVSDDEVEFVDNVDEKEAFHYTWQTTESYRRRFGHWNYHAPYGRSFVYQREQGVIDTAGTGLMVAFDEAGWTEVPKRLALAGTALLSALIWSMYGSKSEKLHEMNVENWVASIIEHPRTPSTHGWRNEQLAVLPPDMAEGLGSMQALWDSEDFRREYAEIHGPLHALSSTSPEWSTAYDRAKQAWESSSSRRKERAHMAPLVDAFTRERERQITGMVAAMNQFMAALHEED